MPPESRTQTLFPPRGRRVRGTPMWSTPAQAAPHPLSIPGLELREKIGEGGASVVYKAVHRNLQRPVAVKVLRATADAAPPSPAWLREPRLMASLAHPHVVAVHAA